MYLQCEVLRGLVLGLTQNYVHSLPSQWMFLELKQKALGCHTLRCMAGCMHQGSVSTAGSRLKNILLTQQAVGHLIAIGCSIHKLHSGF